MSKHHRNIEYYFIDILEAIDDIGIFLSGLSYADFTDNRKTLYAVIRCLEIIGEAVKNIPEEIKTKYPQIPWKEIAGMRDKLIHGYFGVDTGLVWDTARNDIPLLKQEIIKLKEKEFNS
jgi:uncharacterized protein with HEPN domain